ncbi:MAG TPA: SEC-C metal-binding domain-containing protein, partial [Thermoguttaceae bacterium]|nr:SEC-C metal-binding domain-containing protein [Thermoguttaceae bacterium]
IVLGGNPEAMAWGQLQEKYPTRLEVPPEEWDTLVGEIEQREQTKAEGREVIKLGGLHIIGTERHEARRIDLQLRGRCGRQGDPGSSRFYLSLEDDLMRIFAGEWVKNILTRLGMQEGEAIESRMVSRRIEGAQKKVEERNFEIRKNLLEYDEVMDEQRKRVYGYRQDILDGANCKQLILEMIDRQIDHFLGQLLAKDYGTETFAGWAGKELSVELDARDFRGADFNAAQDYAKDQAERMIEGQILEGIDENLPDDADPAEWSWEALAKSVNNRWQLSLRDRDLKRVGREGVAELLIEKAQEALTKVDLSEGARFLERDFGIASARGWVLHKFGIELDLEEVSDLELIPFKELVRSRAEAAYDEKEAEYPVMAGLYHFTKRDSGGHKRYDRESLVDWARDRFHVELSIDDLRNKQRDEIRALLIDHSRHHAAEAREANAEAQSRLEEFFATAATPEEAIREASNNGQAESLSKWLADRLQYELPPETIAKLQPEQLENHISAAVEEQYRPEMRRMERSLLLQLLDSAWKEHLLSMDHLRSSVGLRGYAQVDPKVEFKREGMRIFESMWDSVGARTTDLIFRMEQLDEGFVGSTWTQAEARHDEAMSAGEIAAQQEAAIEGTQADHKPEPIRHRQQRVGRNEPCPCGSGKKFKNCCMKK